MLNPLATCATIRGRAVEGAPHRGTQAAIAANKEAHDVSRVHARITPDDPVDYWLAIDRDLNIVASSYPQLIGSGNLWELHPELRPSCERWYELARLTGAPVEFRTFHRGVVWHCRVEPDDDGFRLECHGVTPPIDDDDLRSLASLMEASRRVAEALTSFVPGPARPGVHEPAPPPAPSPTSPPVLHLV